MEAAQSFFAGRSTSNWSYDALKNLRKISPAVQTHLQRVYTTLTAALLVSALGAYMHMLWGIGGFLTTIGFIASTSWLMSLPAHPSNDGSKLKLLAASAFFQGASLGTLVESVLHYDSSIVAMAFLGTVAVFACFTGAALLARRREYLFLGAILSSTLSLLLMLQFSSLLFGGQALLFNVGLYGGLFLFVGYVLFDTQMIIERADRGDRDYVKHSLDLFVDFVAIFVRLLVILTNNSVEKENKERERRRGGNTSRR